MKASSLFRLPIWKAWATGLCDALIQSSLLPEEARPKLMRARGARVGELTTLAPGLQVSSPENISIGAECYLNNGCTLQGEGGIEIGDRVGFGRNVSIITISHVIGKPEQRGGPMDFKPVTIGEGSWLGSNVTVLPGVSIGRGVVVGGGSVVTKDIPDNFLYDSVPDGSLRELPL